MARHLGNDFLSILVDLGRQVGVENRPKIDPKRHRTKKGRLGCVLGASWVHRGACGAQGTSAARVRRGCDAGADGVLVPPGDAIIKENQYTSHQYWITRHAAGQRPGELLLSLLLLLIALLIIITIIVIVIVIIITVIIIIILI